ncbi:hypothetical protein IJ103_01115 [Candidatus Saccharibacteria bacterium]|nr:hypothetical protein [Candidatus Saccharibacteria bacterium]MBQ9016833.1 hypothetical protein [Candidatus Saccharibacteria bacterium]
MEKKGHIPALECAAVQKMNKVLAALPMGGLEFKVTTYKDGEWIAESVNLDGILTGGKADDDKDRMIRDAIFTYFEIPKEYCDSRLIDAVGEIESAERGSQKTTYIIGHSVPREG